jgi:hypothetical protein
VHRCLPHIPTKPAGVTIELVPQSNTIRLLSDDLNVRVITGGQFGDRAGQPVYDDALHVFLAGIGYGEGSSLVQVVRFNGRCYLKNGYHRAYALGKLGVRHIPCVLLEGSDFSDVTDRMTGFFQRGVLESTNPPTCGHFINNRAYPVSLRARRRIIGLRWTESTRAEP